MSVQALRTALNAVFGKTLTVDQLQRVSLAFYQPQEGETNDQVAEVVLRKLRRRITSLVKDREGAAAAEQARQAAESAIDEEF